MWIPPSIQCVCSQIAPCSLCSVHIHACMHIHACAIASSTQARYLKQASGYRSLTEAGAGAGATRRAARSTLNEDAGSTLKQYLTQYHSNTELVRGGGGGGGGGGPWTQCCTECCGAGDHVSLSLVK